MGGGMLVNWNTRARDIMKLQPHGKGVESGLAGARLDIDHLLQRGCQVIAEKRRPQQKTAGSVDEKQADRNGGQDQPSPALFRALIRPVRY